MIAFISVGQTTGSFIDSRDGKSYKTVKIGIQVWMAENLRYKFSESTISFKIESYGCLYSYEEALKACPSGWHLPADAEWTMLTNYLGGEKVAGGKLKETGTTHWQDPNTGATNETGFTALPAGFRAYPMSGGYGKEAYWWSSTKADEDNALDRGIVYNDITVDRDNDSSGESGYQISVRCLRNN